MTRIWVSKYALSTGIVEIPDAEIRDQLASWERERAFAQYAHGEGKEWHRTLSDAIKRAHVMREDRLKSLRKQIKKLEAMMATEDKFPTIRQLGR